MSRQTVEQLTTKLQTQMTIAHVTVNHHEILHSPSATATNVNPRPLSI